MKARIRWGMACAALFLIIGWSAAADGAAETDVNKTLSPYFLVKSEDAETEQLPLLFTAAEVDIAGVIADVTVTQVYKNEGSSALEAVYVFPGSTRAAVYGLTMRLGDRIIVAEIQEKQQARKNYEQAKKEGKTASLLEQHRPNVFQMNVANILPGDLIQVTLQYTELLVPTDGVYEFVYPTVVGPRYSNKSVTEAGSSEAWVQNPYLQPGEQPPYLFDITTNLSSGIPVQEVDCSTHQVDIQYAGPSSVTIALDDLTLSETIRHLPLERKQRLEQTLLEMDAGQDPGNIPAFYQKLLHAVTAEDTEAEVDPQEKPTFSGNRDYVLRYRLAGNQIASGLLLYEAGKMPVGKMPVGKTPVGKMPVGNDDAASSMPARTGTLPEENFFLLMMQPPERVAAEDLPPREYIFIVDVSGSMSGFPLNISKTLLRDLIGNLRSTDTFNVLLFAGGSTVMSERSLPATRENIRKAIHVIDRQKGGGGTELLPALKRALALPRVEGVSRSVVIATDGYVTVELEAFDLIREHLDQMNVFSFGIGSSVNRFLIEGMARAGQGEAFVITKKSEAKARAEQFRKYIQSPVLTQISVDFDGFDAYDVEPASIPDVLAERPVIVYGKWRGTPQGTITLNGYSGQGAYSQTIDVGATPPDDTNAALRYLWARKRIELLGDYNTLYPSDTRVKEITRLGLEYNLLTQYTSFVAIDKIVRRDPDDPLKTVKQPAPLPQGVSPLAVGGGTMHSTPEPSVPLLLLIAALLIAFALRPEPSARKKRNREVDELMS